MPSLKFSLRLAYRRATSRVRCVPNLLVLGVQKGGTTSLQKYLEEHPSYLPAMVKEVHFLQEEFPRHQDLLQHGKAALLSPLHWWEKVEGRGLNSYRKYFPLRSAVERVRRATGHVIVGDHTPVSLYSARAAQRLVEFGVKARFVVLLRDPVKRAFSDWREFRSNGRVLGETRSFAEAVEAELSGQETRFYQQYLRQGIYEPYLRQWFEVFDRNDFLILGSEDFFADTPSMMRVVFEFLDVPPVEVVTSRAYNTGRYEESLDPELKQRLYRYFEEPNASLERFLGMEFGWGLDSKNAKALPEA